MPTNWSTSQPEWQTTSSGTSPYIFTNTDTYFNAHGERVPPPPAPTPPMPTFYLGTPLRSFESYPQGDLGSLRFTPPGEQDERRAILRISDIRALASFYQASSDQTGRDTWHTLTSYISSHMVASPPPVEPLSHNLAEEVSTRRVSSHPSKPPAGKPIEVPPFLVLSKRTSKVVAAASIPELQNNTNCETLSVGEFDPLEPLRVRAPKGFDISKDKNFFKNNREIFAVCRVCGQTAPLNNCLHDSSQEAICGKCTKIWRFCEFCGKVFDSRQSGNSIRCPICVKLERQCPACGKRTLHKFVDGYCEYCHPVPKAPKESALLHSHTHREFPTFRSLDEKPKPRDLYLGVELETDGYYHGDVGREAAIKALTFLAHRNDSQFFTKNDGSLQNGIEIVTDPATYDYHVATLPWARIRAVTLKYGGRSHETGTAGLHVHANRAFLLQPTDTYGKIVAHNAAVANLLYIHEKFWTELKQFSRRATQNVNRWGGRYYLDMNKLIKCAENIESTAGSKRAIEQQVNISGRYRAVNLGNEDTIEFRSFRGSLNLETIFATIGWIDFLMRFARETPFKDLKQMSWADITRHVDPQRYPQLIAYLRRRELAK